MTAEERRKNILTRLEGAAKPVSAAFLAEALHVSRQIIVGDIALLRAAGHEIQATPRGYLLQEEQKRQTVQLACLHEADATERELTICVDAGCCVLDVVIEHGVYGQITGVLDIRSRLDVELFMEKLRKESARPLLDLTGGVHLHTISYPNEMALNRLTEQLRAEGILYESKEE